jgi:hypothetical protein
MAKTADTTIEPISQLAGRCSSWQLKLPKNTAMRSLAIENWLAREREQELFAPENFFAMPGQSSCSQANNAFLQTVN